MNNPGAPPDWGSIFHRARRRIFGRLLLVAVLAAIGTALLLGGGLSAQGSVSLGLIGNESDTKTDAPKQATKKPGGQERTDEDTGKSKSNSSEATTSDGKSSKPPKPDKPKKHHDQWNPCAGTSAGTQYCDAPEEADGSESTSPTNATVQP